MRGIRAGFSHLLLAGTLLGAAGCAGDSHVFGFNNSGAYTQVGQPEQVPVTRALASLPQSAGRIVAVIGQMNAIRYRCGMWV